MKLLENQENQRPDRLATFGTNPRSQEENPLEGKPKFPFASVIVIAQSQLRLSELTAQPSGNEKIP